MEKKFFFLLYLSLYLLVTPLIAQKKSVEDTVDFQLRTKLSRVHRIQLKAYKQQIDTAGSPIMLGAIYNKIAKTHLETSYYLLHPKLDSARYHANRALLLTKNDTTTFATQEYLNALSWLGVCYTELGNKGEALKYFNQIIERTENIEHPDRFYKFRQRATTESVFINEVQGNFEIAVLQYQLLFDYVEKYQIDKKRISSIVYMKLASLYREMDCADIASEYANKAVKVAYRNKLPFRVAMAYMELAAIKLKDGDYEQTEMFLSKAYEILRDHKQYSVLLSKYYRIQSSLASEKGEIAQQVMYAEKAFELLKNGKFSSEQLIIHKLLAQAYKKVRDYKKAFEVQEMTIALERKLLNSEEIKRNILFEIQRRDDKIIFEQKQNILEQAKGHIKNFIIAIIILLLITVLIIVFFIDKDRQKKENLSALIKEKNERLEELDLAKSRFFANISHEFRTPLTLISSPLQYMLDTPEKDLSLQNKKALQLMGENVSKLQKMVNDILDLSVLESSALELKEQPVEFNSFFHTIVSSFDSFDCQKLAVQYSYDIQILPSTWLLIDSDKLERVVFNLIYNAFKFTRSDDQIIVTANINKDNLIIEVKDTGIGIDEDDQPYIFDRFYQGKEKERALHPGTGLGLTISKEFAILMGGDLTVKSELGKGSAFTLKFPVKKTERTTVSISKTAELKAVLSPLDLEFSKEVIVHDRLFSVLIVEDNFDMRQFVKEIMEDEFITFEAQNGIEALEVIQKEAIDLIISDIMMPEMDGYQLLETLKGNDTYRSIPVIILTALHKEANKLQALTIGIDDYLIKPFLPKELIARAQILLLNSKKRKEWNQEEEILAVDDHDPDSIDVLGIVSKEEMNWMHHVQDRLIEELENDNFRLDGLAKEINLSQRQFQRKIKRITGLTPKQFQQEIALQKARQLLEDDVYANVTAVAYSIGIYNVTRFSKQYECRFGKNPVAYFLIDNQD